MSPEVDDGPPASDTGYWDSILGEQTEVKSPLPALRVVNGANLMEHQAPNREWVVPGLIPGRQVTMLGGDGGVGKSLLGLQLAVAAVSGKEWIGQWVEQGAVLYVSAEDEVDELHRRLEDIAASLGVERSVLRDLNIVDLAEADSILAAPRARSETLEPTAMFAAVSQCISANPASLVIVDTLADVYGGSENHRAQVRAFIKMLRGLCFSHNLAIVVLAHPSLTGISSGSGLSGSTAWNGSVRSRLYLEAVKDEKGDQADPDLRRLSTKKANYSAGTGDVLIRWEKGAFKVEQGQVGFDRAASEAAVDDLFMSLLAATKASGRTVGDKTGRSYAPAIFAGHAKARSVNSKGFAKAMERLFAAGQIRVEIVGPKSKQTSIIVAVGH